MPGGGVDGTYSHFGEFQALLRKWINREARILELLRQIIYSFPMCSHASDMKSDYFLCLIIPFIFARCW